MSKNSHVTRLAICVLVCALIGISSCTTDYVTGKKTFSLVGESQEIAMGKEADPQIVAEYGVYKDPDLEKFIDDLGQALARNSQRAQLTYTFRLLDSPVINAFALPGGYVYVTRGIMAHFNSEDELAGVLGHEIGHVVARHGAEQMSRQQIVGLGLGVGAALSETFRQYAGAAGLGMNLLLLKYSRDQESESDMLGVEYSTKVGYDANRMAEFFQTLDRMSGDSPQSLPGFLSTHPDPGDREVTVHQLAGEWQQKVPFQPLNRNPSDYLKRIDGIVYGADPRQGFMENAMFYHPTMRFQFPVPSDWELVNSPSRVVMVSADKKAAIQFAMGSALTPEQEASEFISKNQAKVLRRQAIDVNGFPATFVESSVADDTQELRILSYFIQMGKNVFVFHGFTIPELYSTHAGDFVKVMGGFEELKDKSIINRQPVRIRIKQSPSSGDLASVLQSLGADAEMLPQLALLNGRELGDRIEKGTWLKTVGP